MKFEDILELGQNVPCFDLATVVQMTGERRSTILQQLHRFSKAGKIHALRRGLYVLAEPYLRNPVYPAELAAHIYRPSYLSLQWALSYYGIIPEAVMVFTSITTRRPRQFRNVYGEFGYQNVRPALFTGYSRVNLSGRTILMASPEKALLDLWYLSHGEWTMERMQEMRFSPRVGIDNLILGSMIRRVGKPRLDHAFSCWQALNKEWEEGEEII